jgi:hypothetical protein
VLLPARAGLGFSYYIIFVDDHVWLLERMMIRRFVRSPRRRAWYVALAAAALLALSGCSDTPAPTPVAGSTATATPTLIPTSAPVPGWQTYSDKTYAYTIQYPPGWTALLEPEPQGAPYEVIGFFAAGNGGSGAAPTQNVITVTAEQVQPDTVDNGTPPGFAPAGSITVAGTTQTLLSGPGSSGGQGLVVMLALNNDVFLFYSTADAASATQFHQTFIQMLSTFKLASSSP